MFRFDLTALPLVLFLCLICMPANAQQTCLAPAMHVEITGMTEGDDGSGVVTTMLHLTDPNPAERVSGYNVYRSPTSSAAPGSWALLAVDAMDEDAAMPGIQWSDNSGQASPTGLFFYVAAAYNGHCDAEGPRTRPSVEDADGDGVADQDDPCPATPRGATLLMEGCSATDFLLKPELLVVPVDSGLESFLSETELADIPIQILTGIDQARLALESVSDDLLAAQPCPAADSFGTVVGHLDDTRLAFEEFLLTLNGGASSGQTWPTEGIDADHSDDMDGSYQYPPPEYLYWSGQLFKLMSVHADAVEGSAINDQVCAAEGEQVELSGQVRRISDRDRRLELDDGARIVIPWTASIDGDDLLAEDRPVAGQGTSYNDGITVATFLQTQPSPFPFIETEVYDNCLQLRILPVQPLPGAPYPQPGWIRHSPEGYRGGDTVLALEAGMKLVTEDNGCPGIVPGLGPGGKDVRIDYHYELLLNYQPRQGAWINLAPLALKVNGNSHPILLPDMDPAVNGTLFASKVKRTCIGSGFTLPIIDPESGNVVGTRPVWNCSAEQVVELDQYTVLVRDPQSYCDVAYSTDVFDIEDHDLTDWRATSASGVSVLPGVVPTPVVFTAEGDKIVNNTPVSSTLGLNEDFAVYSPFAQTRQGFGTDRKSQLDWPHITGTRNAEAFRYTCSLAQLQTDLVASCPGVPATYYRMPFPQNTDSLITQGNGGSHSHSGWQWFALDIKGNAGDPLRAARGGKVVMIRTDMTLNCETQTCTQFGAPPGGRLDEFGNHVALQHQDGTVAWYMHMVQGSSPLKLGDRVMRGGYLGQLGNTGNSTGPHLHFQVTPGDPGLWYGMTRDVRYEAFSLYDSTLETCMVPQVTLTYRSTNLP